MTTPDKPLIIRILEKICRFFSETPAGSRENARVAPASPAEPASEAVITPAPAAVDDLAGTAGETDLAVESLFDTAAEPAPELPAVETEVALVMDGGATEQMSSEPSPIAESDVIHAAVEALEGVAADDPAALAIPDGDEIVEVAPVKTRKPRAKKPAVPPAVEPAAPAKPARKPRARKAPAADATTPEAVAETKPATRKPRAKPALKTDAKAVTDKPKAPRKPRSKPVQKTDI